MQTITTQDMLNNVYQIQVGVDKNNIPVFVGDTVVEDISYEFSSDYWDGYESRARKSYPNEITKRMCQGKIYRKVTFNGTQFELKRVKEEGNLPKGESYSIWADQDTLNRYTKI